MIARSKTHVFPPQSAKLDRFNKRVLRRCQSKTNTAFGFVFGPTWTRNSRYGHS